MDGGGWRKQSLMGIFLLLTCLRRNVFKPKGVSLLYPHFMFDRLSAGGRFASVKIKVTQLIPTSARNSSRK